MIESVFYKVNPFMWCLILSGVSLVFFTLKQKKAAIITAITVFILQTLGIAMRSYIGGRAPVTNMYETVLACGYFALFIMLIFYIKRKESILLLSGVALNTLTLLMVNFATNMLNPKIGALMPVLRSNFWLSVHVTTIVIAYSGLALSWIFANGHVISTLLYGKSDGKKISRWVYTNVKIGVIFLIIGIVTGAIWADYSWGRFWGWDPKETWALIVLLIYMAILHGKYTSWISSEKFIPLCAFAFLFVMMAWFGVNYILASGLHSYGFSNGGAAFLTAFLIAQISLLGVYGIKRRG